MRESRTVVLIGAELEESLALRTLAGALQAAGHRIELLPFNGPVALERVATAAAHAEPDLIGLSMVFTRRAREFVELAARIKALGCTSPIIAGGHFATFHAAELLRDAPALDLIARGEGEHILLSLLDHLDEPERVDGLSWRGEEGVVHNEAADKPADLDDLPWPMHRDPPDRVLGLGAAPLLSSRGCLSACSFCSIAAWHRHCGGERHRLRQMEAVCDEMAALHARGVRVFNFHDDHFFLRDRVAMLERIDELGAALAARGLGRIALATKCRPDAVDEEVLQRLKGLGLFRVFLGIEAGSAQALRQLGRGQRVAHNERALATVNHLELHATYNLLLFNPRSTLTDISENVAFLRRNALNPTNFCRTEIYAGTPLLRRLEREGRLLGDYWGHHYRIAEPAAQTAFELTLGSSEAAFTHRNFDLAGAHHLSMRVDFEYQLYEHFAGRSADLRARVKQLVVDIKHDTADHLDWLLEALAERTEPTALGIALRNRVHAADVLLEARARALLVEIDRSARGAGPRPSRLSRALRTAGLAAGLTMLTAVGGCKTTETMHTEMVAPPTEPEHPDTNDKTEGEPNADHDRPVPPQIEAALRPIFEAEWHSPERVLLEFGVDQDGHVDSGNLRTIYRGEGSKTLDTALHKAVMELRFEDPAQRSTLYRVSWRSGFFGVSQTSPWQPPPVMAPEMAPAPMPEPRPPHPPMHTEMAPRPQPPRSPPPEEPDGEG